MRKNRKWSVCTPAILDFPAKQDTGIFLKIKELRHLANTKPEHMPFDFFRYLIEFSRYEGKSEMVSLFGGHFGFSRQTGYSIENQGTVSPTTQDTWTKAVKNFKISHLDLKLWGK